MISIYNFVTETVNSLLKYRHAGRGAHEVKSFEKVQKMTAHPHHDSHDELHESLIGIDNGIRFVSSKSKN